MGMCTGLWYKKYFLLKVIVKKKMAEVSDLQYPRWSTLYLALHYHLIHVPLESLGPSLNGLLTIPQPCYAHFY